MPRYATTQGQYARVSAPPRVHSSKKPRPEIRAGLCMKAQPAHEAHGPGWLVLHDAANGHFSALAHFEQVHAAGQRGRQPQQVVGTQGSRGQHQAARQVA